MCRQDCAFVVRMQQGKWVIAILVLFMFQIFKKCIQLNMISKYGINNCIKQIEHNSGRYRKHVHVWIMGTFFSVVKKCGY